ncbi:hypothetical protein KHQ84_gp028 [Rhodococcus phage Finch]|uniref:Uncharacterized protein n=1 Tax=Rhodococcus phage Finch TaxID=2094144 RepID=A0A2P1JXW7_9CAUD|nr:hypothetical protein KHQ84_gp028 [Rhodococcus phage Finch]AVO25165.1 hypothetical protein SEA_FINCH_28 [Rhodococcus phage Finch]
MNHYDQGASPFFWLCLGLLLLIAIALLSQDGKLRKVGTLMSIFSDQLKELNDNLDEAGNEIVEELLKLREALEAKDVLDADDIALLDSISAKAKSLADIVPDEVVEPEEPTEPAVPEIPEPAKED